MDLIAVAAAATAALAILPLAFRPCPACGYLKRRAPAIHQRCPGRGWSRLARVWIAAIIGWGAAAIGWGLRPPLGG
jgi:hypothetical protein